MARMRDPSYRPVRLTGKYTQSDGRDVHLAAANLEVRVAMSADAVAIGADGKPQTKPSPWPARFEVAKHNKEFADVLELLSRDAPLGWVELYKIYEVVREASRPRRITDLGWWTKAEESAFTGSANRPDVSGLEARHARVSGETPRSSVSLVEGRAQISRLVMSWIDSLVGG